MQPLVGDDERRQVGLGEVAVVVEGFFAALAAGRAAGRIEAPGFAVDFLAGFGLTPEALALLTDGVELRGARLRPWYERASA